MGMPALLTRAGTGTTAPWIPDWLQDPFSVGCQIQIAGATANLEVTYADLNTISPVNALWTVVATGGANFTAALSAPVTGIRLNVITSLATGIVTGNFIQATFPR